MNSGGGGTCFRLMYVRPLTFLLIFSILQIVAWSCHGVMITQVTYYDIPENKNHCYKIKGDMALK